MRKTYEYEILVDGRIVWKGQNPGKKFDELRKRYPDKRVGIAWRPAKGVLVAFY